MWFGSVWSGAVCLVCQVGFGASPTYRDPSVKTVSGAASLLQGGIVDRIKSGLQMVMIGSLPMVVDLPAVRPRLCRVHSVSPYAPDPATAVA